MRRKFALLLTLIMLSGCALAGCQQEQENNQVESDWTGSVEAVCDNVINVGDFLGMTYAEIESAGRIKELSHFRSGGSPVYSLTEYDGVYLLFPSVNDVSSTEAVREEIWGEFPIKLLTDDSSVEVYPGLCAGMSAEEVKKAAVQWDDIYISSENSLYYTSFVHDSWKITAAWAVPEEMFSEWCGSLSDEDDYYAEFLEFIKPFRHEPVGVVVELSLEKIE